MRALFRLSSLLLGLLALPLLTAQGEPPASEKARPNRLAKESSPYLLQHAHNPVDWYPWGPEAFAKAKKENKLVFLSVGYSSCHWCHVMEKESFSRADVAEILNKHFVCIKVDREERPDVDHVYMTALQALGEQGGWPMSMWMTADGRPFFGGTYFPREDSEVDGQTVRGFKSLLGVVLKVQEKEPKKIEEIADKVAKLTTTALRGESRGKAIVALDRELVAGCVAGLREEFDPVYGGFGSPLRKFRGTKFPMPPTLLFLQTELNRKKTKEIDEILSLTLNQMARGGIYDQLGGGFHRYSTERTWTVPHFEKMLYDNAQLLEVYARALKGSKNPFYERVLRETIAFVDRELSSPDGGFYSALDADSEGEEGRFYVWTAKDLDAALKPHGENAALFRKSYGLDDTPNFEGSAYVLRLANVPEPDVERRLAAIRKALFEIRPKRARPFLDTKVLTAWNGQMIAGLARAGQALKDDAAVARAEKAAEFVLKNMRTKDARLLRTWGAAPGEKPSARVPGYLDDYAYLVHGLLTLHDVTGKPRYLAEAKGLTDTMIRFHADTGAGGFFSTASDHEKLFARGKEQYDGVQPSGNSAATMNLVRLWQKTGEVRYRDLARKSFESLAGSFKANPTSVPALAEALSIYLTASER
jgi:uncharacterized protein